jgi:hypothetical protein
LRRGIDSNLQRHLLPRKGQVHPLVNKFDGGSMIMIVILTSFTVGALLMAASFIG